jgi:hypothetical protein
MRYNPDSFWAYDRGQFNQVATVPKRLCRALIGPSGVQPYEEELIREYPGAYLPVDFDSTGEAYLLYRSTASSQSENWLRGDKIPRLIYDTPGTPGYHSGYWRTDSYGVYRLLAGKVIPCELGAGLPGLRGTTVVLEDRAHNLWIYHSSFSRNNSVYMKKLSDFAIKCGKVPAKVGSTLTINAEPVIPGLEAKDLRVFWRVDGSDWQGGKLGGTVTITFPKSGKYKVELMGMEPTGGTTSKNVEFTINATVTQSTE